MPFGPSGGMMKKLFDPTNMKKKMKNAAGMQKSGGNKPKRPEMPPQRMQNGEGKAKRMKLINGGNSV